MTPQHPNDKPLTKKEAAALVSRTVPVIGKDGKPEMDKDGSARTKRQPIDEAEVFSFRDHGDHVMVVTVDGQKFRGEKK